MKVSQRYRAIRMQWAAAPVVLLLVTVMAMALNPTYASASHLKSTSTNAHRSSKAAPIRIGTMLSLSGAIAAECLPSKIGLLATFDAANAAGGVNGRKIDDTILDDQSNSTQVAAEARTLLSQNIFAFVGACDSAEASALEPVASSAKIPYLFPFTAVPSLLSPVQPEIFDGVPLYETQEASIVKAVAQRYGKGSIYAAVVQAPDFQQQLSAVQTAANTSGMKYVGGTAIVPNASDISPIVLQIENLRPHYLFLNTEAADSVRIVNQLITAGFMPPKIIGVQNLMLDPFVQSVDSSALSHVVAVSPVPGSEGPRATACRNAVNRYFPGSPVTFATVEACSTAEATVSALKLAAKHLTNSGFIAAMDKVRNVQLTPLEPNMSFSRANHLGVKSLFLLGVKKNRTRYVIAQVRL